ncbi:RNA polymerase II transcription factor B subunit 4 [Sporormia fimetaria CBS 119925]|uniref:General transcription and DNA repair factor IIH subunit TFB4 n=1 Tax=Sporormia fimetaria CBS 119925 TaxID=1340428 RepID=A0A6A6VA82_9PLEO|nr:RNA polymerase II transcription factor B subunit 4 [Sporormia fimetaria CBS 119925]
MNAIDGTDRSSHIDESPPPSLLAIILDTNPHAWAELSSTLPLSTAIANLLVFINAHLASSTDNEVCVIASHTNRATWLYPTPKPATSTQNGTTTTTTPPSIPDNPNKFRPFTTIESALLTNLSSLLNTTSESSLQSTSTTLLGGAFTLALTRIAKSVLLHSPTPTLPSNNSNTLALPEADAPGTTRIPLTARILIVSVSGDLAHQYIPVMNSIFAAQRRRIPIDILKLAGDTVLLQQASDATGGVYLKPEHPAGLLQYLMMGFLPDASARKAVVMPGKGGVDFRAACFCHRRVVDVGFVCSVCLSIFCEPKLPNNLCLTCGSHLSLRTTTSKTPALATRKKKKKKKPTPGGADSLTVSAGTTPVGSNVGTPMHP